MNNKGKIKEKKIARDIAQRLDLLPDMHKTLDLTPSHASAGRVT
jgi:hypothetical protein